MRSVEKLGRFCKGSRFLALCLLGGACTGEVGELQLDPGPSPLRLISRFEYNNAIRDLLGDDTLPARSFAADADEVAVDNLAPALGMTRAQAEKYMEAAEGLARTAVGDLTRLLPCDPTPDEEACVRTFIAEFLHKAYRRHPTHDERARMLELFRTARQTERLADALGLVIEATLQSPHFLYRVEFGRPEPARPGMAALTGEEVAARLSFFLWGSIPDNDLLTAAEAGALATREGIAQQAERMLEDGRAHTMVRHFYGRWLGIDAVETLVKDGSEYPTYNGELRLQWKEETLTFVEHSVFAGSGTLRELLTASYTFVNRDLAAFYGLSGPQGDDYQLVALDPTERAGILTHASVLATNARPGRTSPVARGKFIRERLLCDRIPPPPANATAPPPNLTQREASAQRMADPNCSTCHALLDPIGNGFEHYDGVGLWRHSDLDGAIDAHGELASTVDTNGDFHGAVELARELASSEQVSACAVTAWFRYAFGRAEQPADDATLHQLQQEFRSSGKRIRALLVAITQTDAFRFRRAVTAGR